MRRYGSKALPLIAAAAAVLLAAGCSSADGSSATGKVLTVGVLTSLTGSFAQDGTATEDGVELAVNQINAQGGIKALGGAKLKVVTVDSGTSGSAAAAAAAAQLASKNPVFVFNGPVSASVAPSAAVLDRAKIPECTDGELATLTTSGLRYLVRLPQSGTGAAGAAVKYFPTALQASSASASRVAGVYDSNPAQISVTQAFLDEVNKLPGTSVVYSGEFPLGETNLAPVGAKIAAAKPDILVPGTSVPELQGIEDALHSSGLDLPVFSAGGGISTEEYYESQLGKAVNGQFTIAQFDHSVNFSAAQNKLMATANSQYKEDFHAPFLGEAAGEAYTCTWDMATAMESAKSTDPAKIRQALDQPITSGPGSLELPGKVEFNASGQNIYGSSVLSEWCHGNLSVVAPANLATTKAQAPKACGG
jgi:branched-chain amino acid transport system substrate-binding protein